VAKILVADDNSNIQKMVGLALKDQGIDVIAVGNGEAAVRKIADLRPDLVLADVFMPVRNGYEVCQFVKADAALSHIPVILLVGAFDPLDEQEAQRVGADGVLKKPFVPPDPLISMVKSALQRAGVVQGSASAERTPEPEAPRAPDTFTPIGGAVAPPGSVPARTNPPEPAMAALDKESFVDDVPAGPPPVEIGSGSQTVAFGSLLETPAEEKDDDISFVTPTHPELTDERDWRDPDAEETGEEGEETSSSWRPEKSKSYDEAGSIDGAKDWRSGSFDQILTRKPEVESWEREEEETEVVEAAPAASNLVAETPSAPATSSEAPSPEVAISSKPFGTDEWTSASSPASLEEKPRETSTVVEEETPVKVQEPSSTETGDADAPKVAEVAPLTKTSKESWFSVPSNPWNAEMEKANRLASSWDTAAPVPAPPGSSNGAENATPDVSETIKKVLEQEALPGAAVEAAADEETADVSEYATRVEEQHASEATSFYAHEVTSEAPAAALGSMDEVVAKVMANLSPDVLQAVTREILKPVIEAMVKEEMKSKKS
jgi:CheY-like chemotaxis protein